MEIEYLKSKLPAYLERISVKERSGLYHCPLCGSGTHRGERSDGAFSVYDNDTRWHCFACNQSGDIFTLIGFIEQLPDFPQQIRYAKELFGIADSQHPMYPTKKSPNRNQTVNSNYRDYIKQCIENVCQTDYWTKMRGFSDEIVQRFQLGYDAEKQAVVIPYDASHSYYITRSVKEKAFRKPRSSEAGEEPIFRRDGLYQSEMPCFVCESPIDAISVMAASPYPAISVGGTGVRKLLAQLDENAPSCPLILCFDADEAGKKASEILGKELMARQISFAYAEFDLSVYPESRRKDANDYFIGNREAFTQQLTQIAESLCRSSAAVLDEAQRSHEANTGAHRLSGFLDSIHNESTMDAIPSGFSDLDEVLDGGFFAGLYILGAISSLGKTTFLLQTADQIAASGTDVLYFSLEMSANELIAKSVSRQTYLLCNDDTRKAKTVRGITTKSRYPGYSEAERCLIDQAVLAYQKYAGKLYYYEGIGDIGAAEIRRRTEAHIKLTGRTPVVMIDYLQILAPYDLRASDKQNMDKAVLELKRLSRDCNLPVIAISSLNRDSYHSGEIEMNAFKESGAIEYGSDVLIGLQVQGLSGKGAAQENQKKIQQCKEHAIRNVELKILKNRNGRTGNKIGLRYYAMFNCFTRDESYVQQAISDGIQNDDFEPAL